MATYGQLAQELTQYAEDQEAWDEEVVFVHVQSKRQFETLDGDQLLDARGQVQIQLLEQ